MQDKSEKAVLRFLKNFDFPGIRFGEGNKQVCDYLKLNGYNYTPDLVAGPENIEDAPVEGLFFIEVINPTSDLLFQSKFFENYDFDTPKVFKELLFEKTSTNGSVNIDMLPNNHQECYLDKYNSKLDKYAHQRKFLDNGPLKVSCNLGIVRHFNLGKIKGNKISAIKELITLLDYFRFYKRLAPSDNIDLKNAETRLLKELINNDQKSPFIQLVGREPENLPCLFHILHVSLEKNESIHDLAVIVLNTTILDSIDGNHPVHKWFFRKIFHPKNKMHLNNETPTEKVNITLNNQVFT